jgi:hypothetical protein
MSCFLLRNKEITDKLRRILLLGQEETLDMDKLESPKDLNHMKSPLENSFEFQEEEELLS